MACQGRGILSLAPSLWVTRVVVLPSKDVQWGYLAVPGISEPQLPRKELQNTYAVLGQSLLPFKNPQTPKLGYSFALSEHAGCASMYESPNMNHLFKYLFPLLDTMS